MAGVIVRGERGLLFNGDSDSIEHGSSGSILCAIGENNIFSKDCWGLVWERVLCRGERADLMVSLLVGGVFTGYYW